MLSEDQLWKRDTLGNLVNLKRGYDLPSRLRIDGDHPIYSSSGISGFHGDYMREPPGVITGRYGTIGQVFHSDTRYWPLNTTLYVQDFKGNHSRFVYYFLKTLDWEKYSDKSAVPGVNRNDVHKEEVAFPGISEQRAIASILSSLDDKIDLLHRQNKTLEAMAETLFRQWFVEVASASNWPRKRISEVTKSIQYGFTQSASTENVGPKFLRITDIQGGNVKWSDVPYCLATNEELEKYRLQHGDIVIARTGASTGENFYCYKPENAVFASYLIRLQFEEPTFARYVAMHTRSADYFDYIGGILSGSAQPNANAQELTTFEIAVPPRILLSEFYSAAVGFDEKRHNNEKQIITLEKLRDNLLPKLMSGDVRVQHE